MRPGVLATLLILVVAAGGTLQAVSSAEGEAPNVLIILTDDQRPGTMSAMPETRRWFRDGGVRYPNAYVTTPLCCPSRASILTGRYAHNHGVEDNHSVHALDFDPTVPGLLKEAGYATGYAGRFLNGWSQNPPHFDRWSTFVSPLTGNGYTETLFNEDGEERLVGRYSTDYLRHWAVELLEAWEADDDRPWYLTVAPFAPHLRAIPASAFQEAHVSSWNPSPAVLEDQRGDKPPHVRDSSVSLAAQAKVRAAQLRTLRSVDLLVETLMGLLGELGERGDTLAFYLADNGFLWGEHGVGGKRHPYEDSIGVPMFARWPGRLPAGTRDGRLVANIDVPATVVDAAGVAPGWTLDGRSLLRPWDRERLFLEYSLDPDSDVPSWRSILTADLQYIEYLADDAVFFREYYDLRDDPWQLQNLLEDGKAGNDPPDAELAALAVQVEQDASCSGTDGLGACP